jgi:L-2,4-diaminobutyrate decarboxylase
MSPDSPGRSGTHRAIPDADALLAQLDADLEADTTLAAAEPLLALAAQYLAETRLGEGPVSTWHSAQTIADRLEAEIPRRGRPLADVARRLAVTLLEDINRLAHPMYIGHQVAAPLPAAVWADALISALNQSLAVREMSPSFTPLEHQVVAWMTDLVGWDERAGGTMTSGGTEATLSALLAARSRAIPNVWTHGVPAHAPVLVCGEHTHYAVTRAAGEMGLGLHRVHVVSSHNYRMDVGALRTKLKALHDHHTPVMAVVATAGSTATGSFDDLNAIADACAEFRDAHGDLWLHVDADHGGAALLSAEHRHRVNGIERARSIAWDPHKGLLLPLAAGMLLMRDERELTAAFAQQAPYLFTQADDAKAWDTGPRSFQCSRRADVLKLYVALERYGADALAAMYDRSCRLARVLYDTLSARDDFTVLHEPETNILSFAWTPRGVPAPQLNDLTDLLRERYNRSGRGWITVTTLGKQRVLRITVMNARTAESHIARLVEGLVAEGRAVLGHAGFA